MAVCPVRNGLHFDSLVVRVSWRKRAQVKRALVVAHEVLHRPCKLTGLSVGVEQHLTACVLSRLGRHHVLRGNLDSIELPRVLQDHLLLGRSDLPVRQDAAQHTAICVKQLLKRGALSGGRLVKLVAQDAPLASIVALVLGSATVVDRSV